MKEEKKMKKTYILEDLDCAHCAEADDRSGRREGG